MSPAPRLVQLGSAAAPIALDPRTPLTVGRDPANGLSLPQDPGLSRRHAEVRHQPGGGWQVCDLASSNGTYLNGERLAGCRPLEDGDQIRLGRQGPVLVFRSGPVVGPSAPAPVPPAPVQPVAPVQPPAPFQPVAPRSPERLPPPQGPAGAAAAPVPTGQPRAPAPPAVLEGSITVGGRSVPLVQIRAVSLRHEPCHPHSFSWWVLACLSGLLLLPFRPLFLVVEISALVVWLTLGRRQEHVLTLTLRDGMAHHHGFRDRATALAHRNGIRRALGQAVEP
jgi:hypothetical protein